MKNRPAYLCAVAAALFPALVFAQSMEEGRRAANRGDFTAAIRNWKPLADQGNAEAQYNLGRMYARGDGVRRDFVRAQELFLASAEQGNRAAAEKLAMLYERGDGVERNLQTASYWRKVSRGEIPAASRQSFPAESSSAAQVSAQNSSEPFRQVPEPQFLTPEPPPEAAHSSDSWTMNGGSSSSPPKNLRGLLSALLAPESGSNSSALSMTAQSSQGNIPGTTPSGEPISRVTEEQERSDALTINQHIDIRVKRGM